MRIVVALLAVVAIAVAFSLLHFGREEFDNSYQLTGSLHPENEDEVARPPIPAVERRNAEVGEIRSSHEETN